MEGLTHRWLAPATEAADGAGAPGDLAARVLRARGIGPGSAAAAFCDPRLSSLHDPSLIPDLDRAAGRMLDALRAGEPVVIYGDYDVDGVAASAILFHMCRAIAPGAPVRVYIPHRVDEGYGLSGVALRELRAEGTSLVVSVDCGVTAAEPAREARACGLDLIITDHHNPPRRLEDLPSAFAVVHPGRPDSDYPFKELCGAGVAFKLAWRLATLATGAERVGATLRDLLLDLLALAALGTIADIVPLLDENRIIARFGLAKMKSTRFTGLNALIAASGLAADDISAEHVGFALGPRLNACGRMGHAREAVELLTIDDAARCREIAAMLTKQNERRRAVERSIFDQASGMADAAGMTRDDRRAIVLAHDEWHPGVVGIVCSRLVGRFGRPSILMQRREGACHGSCRSVDGFSIHAGLEACAHHLESFGGHDMAAGLRLLESKLPAFVDDFTGFVNERVSVEQLAPALRIDCDATISELTPLAVERLERLGPFGRANPSPSLRLTELTATRAPEAMGAHGRHMSFVARQGNRMIRLVGWSWGEHRARIPAGAALEAVIRPKINRWNGRESVEGEICDVRIVPGA